MRESRVKRFFAVLISAVVFVLSACQASSVGLSSISRIREEFEDNGKNEPYSQQIPLEEMDFSVYNQYVNLPKAAIQDNSPKKMELLGDVSYYKSPEDQEPSVVLKKGTVVYVNSSLGLEAGYGMQGWPAYQEGWRYAQPFDVYEGGKAQVTGEGWYYVRTENLFEVADGYYRAAKVTAMPPEQCRKNVVMYVDISLYLSGAFCSPDIEKYYASREDIGVT